jgi:integrase/recombinase XerD
MALRRRPEIEPAEPGDLAAHALRFLEWLRERGYSDHTVEGRRFALAELLAWCSERGLTRPEQLSLEVLELYQRHLGRRAKADGEPLTMQTQANYLIDVKSYCRWLARSKLILYSPAADLVLPRVPDKIPRNVLTRLEVEQVLNTPDVSTPLGLRDRAMLETLYSTGLRRAELAKLELTDLDLDRGLALVREGKYRKDRMVPIGERALAWVDSYLERSRPAIVTPPDDGNLFLNRWGRPLVPGRVTKITAAVMRASGVDKPGAAHIFRHTMATHMLEAGMDTRYIQHILGHSSLEATQVYTRVGITKLKEVHRTTPPGADLRRGSPPAAGGDGGTAAKHDKAVASPPTILLDDGDDEAEQLLSSLAAEDAAADVLDEDDDELDG